MAYQLGAMLLWRFGRKKLTRMPQSSRAPFGPFFILNAVFLIWDSAVNWATVPSSVGTDTLQCSFDISRSESCSGLCRCSFSAALVWMMRLSSLRSLAWKVHRSAAWHSSQKMSSPHDFVSMRWNTLLALNKSLYSLKGRIMTLVLPHSTSQALLCSWAHSVVKLDQLVSRDAPCCCVKA